jgi:predicted phage terminase large subunit-like protein
VADSNATDVKKQLQSELRFRARTDLFWLAHEILGFEDLIPRVHQPVADHFYQMKPGTPIALVDDVKGMSLYDPRAHFKTSLAIASAIQWLINYPNIRVFIGAGKLDRASDSLVAIKWHFQHNPKLRRLFPEFCPPPTKDWGTTTEFTLPNRTKALVDPSCMAFSMDSIKAGPHCDVMFIDDAVHQDNIGTADQLENTIDRFRFMRSIVEPYGYIHVIGTPYSDSDLYAWLEEPENGSWLRKFRRPVWTIINPTYDPLKRKLEATDVQLLFPERFTFDYLNSMRTAAGGGYIFNCQYLLDPTPLDTTTFTEALIDSHTIPHNHIPKYGTVFNSWDLGFSEKKRADYTAGFTGLFDPSGNLFILDGVMDRFSPYDTVQMIARQALKWRPNKTGIEDAAGSKLISPALDNIQRALNQSFPVEWVPVSNTKHKEERILSLQTLLVQNKLYFSNAIPPDVWKLLKYQFLKFPRTAHDDGPDAISQLLHFRSRVDHIPPSEYGGFEAEITSVSYDHADDNLMGAGIIG